MLEIFMVNAIKMLIKRLQLDFFGTNSLESKEVVRDNQVLKFVFDENILSSIIEPTILDQLKK